MPAEPTTHQSTVDDCPEYEIFDPKNPGYGVMAVECCKCQLGCDAESATNTYNANFGAVFGTGFSAAR